MHAYEGSKVVENLSLLDLEIVSNAGKADLTPKGNGLSLSLLWSIFGTKKPRKMRCNFLRFSPTSPANILQGKTGDEWQLLIDIGTSDGVFLVKNLYALMV